ncbi:hypothetical protein [Rhodococcoides fascians]|uniref:hypothetical protein n=1 Tax=Rhodococcoides fascians TaxID=1828 RepID=UPI0005677A74|nr:hypothetical protein [Rhodococcus fascians]
MSRRKPSTAASVIYALFAIGVINIVAQWIAANLTLVLIIAGSVGAIMLARHINHRIHANTLQQQREDDATALRADIQNYLALNDDPAGIYGYIHANEPAVRETYRR